jgi:hypothetical protein
VAVVVELNPLLRLVVVVSVAVALVVVRVLTPILRQVLITLEAVAVEKIVDQVDQVDLVLC